MAIFESSNYRIFLNNRMKKLQVSGRGVKTKLAEHLNINSTMISQILSGTKDFSIEQAIKVAQYLGLQKLETDYFIILVQIERAGTQDLKHYYLEKRNQLRKDSLKLANRIQSDKELTDLERSIFYSSKIYSSIHLFTSLGKGKTLDEILERFDLKRNRAREIISFLLSAGLIIDKNGIYHMEGKSTHVEKGSPFLLNHHINWRIKSVDKAERLSAEEMMYTGNFSLSKKDFLKVREELVQSLQRVIDTVKESPAEELANLNIDFFWI
jgi:uncharacterized protein (TIGR02147 family)